MKVTPAPMLGSGVDLTTFPGLILGTEQVIKLVVEVIHALVEFESPATASQLFKLLTLLKVLPEVTFL